MSNKAKIYVYKEGNECSSITGGWSSARASVTNSNNELVFETSSTTARASCATNRTFDLTKFSDIYVDITQATLTSSTNIPNLTFCTDSQQHIENGAIVGDQVELIRITDQKVGITKSFQGLAKINIVNAGNYYIGFKKNATTTSTKAKVQINNIYMNSKIDVINILNQDNNLLEVTFNNLDNLISIAQVNILTNGRVIQSYTENLDSIIYTFDETLMDCGNNKISIQAVYTQGDNIYEIAELISDIPYKKEVVLEEFEPVVDLPYTANIRDIVSRISLISSANKAIKNNLKTLLEAKGFVVGENPRLSNIVKLVNELSNNNSAEITEYINRITELESENEANKRTLISKLEKFNIKLVGDENINALINLIDVNNLNLINIKQIACGNSFVVILKKDGSLWGCGYNQDGQLGLGDNNGRTTMTQITTNINNDVKYVACGANVTFIIKNDGSLWASGWNDHGQLGLGNNVKRNTFAKVTTNINNDVEQIVNCYCSTFILKNDGSLWACGLNNYGQLGLGDTTNRNVFTKVTTNVNNDVKQISCMGAIYPASTGALFYGSAAILKIDGSIWTAGYNAQGQLGLGDTTNRNTFTKVTTNINNDVKQILCGGYSMYVLKNDDSIWSCGYNAYGQLGLGDTSNRNTFTQVTTNVNNDVKQIVSGGGHVFILKNDGSLWSCGNNSYGQLGLNNTTNKTTFTQVATNIELVECGGHMSSAINGFTFIIKTDGSLWACGRNNEGQLGLGDTTDRTTFIKIPRGF